MTHPYFATAIGLSAAPVRVVDWTTTTVDGPVTEGAVTVTTLGVVGVAVTVIAVGWLDAAEKENLLELVERYENPEIDENEPVALVRPPVPVAAPETAAKL